MFFYGFLLLLLSFVSICRPVREVVQDIHHGNWLKFGTGKLKELCKLLPDESEVTTAPLLFFFHLLIVILCALSQAKKLLEYFNARYSPEIYLNIKTPYKLTKKKSED